VTPDENTKKLNLFPASMIYSTLLFGELVVQQEILPCLKTKESGHDKLFAPVDLYK